MHNEYHPLSNHRTVSEVHVSLLFVIYRVNSLLTHTGQLLKVNPALKHHYIEFIGLKICNIQYFNKISVFNFMHLYINKPVFKSFMGCFDSWWHRLSARSLQTGLFSLSPCSGLLGWFYMWILEVVLQKASKKSTS